MTDVKGVLFDFDMTLIDSSYAIYYCTNLFAARFGLRRIPREEVLASIGKTIDVSWKGYWGSYKKEWLAYYRANLIEEERSRIRLFPHSAETLRALRGVGLKTGVVSNRNSAFKVVERVGLGGLVDTVVGLEDVTKPKPDPEPLIKGFEGLGLLPSDGVFVGDTDIDMRAAAAAGAPGIGMTTGNFDEAGLKAAGASFVLNDLSELPALLGVRRQ